VFSSKVLAEYLNSDARSTSVGIPAKGSIRYFPVKEAWKEVPQATNTILLIESFTSSTIFLMFSFSV